MCVQIWLHYDWFMLCFLQFTCDMMNTRRYVIVTINHYRQQSLCYWLVFTVCKLPANVRPSIVLWS